MNKKIPTPLAILIIILVIAVIAGISLWFCPEKRTENVACTQEVKLCPDGSYVGRTGPNCEFALCSVIHKEETDNSSSTKPTGKTTAYQVTVSEIDSSIKESEMLRFYLEKLFSLPKDSISRIVFDTRKGQSYENIYNSTYYILVISENDLKPEYEERNIRVQTSKIDELFLYIQDPDYCETDEDCVIRNEFCSLGSFNYYHGFHDIWGCEQAFYPEESEESLDVCDEGTQHVKVEYSGSKCINHQCLAQNKTVTCVQGAIP